MHDACDVLFYVPVDYLSSIYAMGIGHRFYSRREFIGPAEHLRCSFRIINMTIAETHLARYGINSARSSIVTPNQTCARLRDGGYMGVGDPTPPARDGVVRTGADTRENRCGHCREHKNISL